MKTRIELTETELKVVMDALHLLRCTAESLHISKQIKIGEMNLTEIERIRVIFSDRFYRLIEKFPIS